MAVANFRPGAECCLKWSNKSLSVVFNCSFYQCFMFLRFFDLDDSFAPKEEQIMPQNTHLTQITTMLRILKVMGLLSSVHFSSVQDGICVLRTAHAHFTLSQ